MGITSTLMETVIRLVLKAILVKPQLEIALYALMVVQHVRMFIITLVCLVLLVSENIFSVN